MKDPRGGFTVVELLVGAVIGAITLAGAFRLWKSNQEESFRLQKKTELRDKMALSSKHLQRAITLAGYGLRKSPGMAKMDEVGSDTLVVYTNGEEIRSGFLSNLYVGQYAIYVENGAAFANVRYMAISDTAKGEVKPIDRVQGNVVVLARPLEAAYNRLDSWALPARREKFYTDQDSLRLIRVVDGTPRVIAEDVRNFQISFKDDSGNSTEVLNQVRAVQFSFTGVFPAREGAINSEVFTSTAIPRNLL
jgi:Tfp pilus assembly protein PilW